MPDDVASLRRDLHAGRERLLTVVAGVTEEQFKRRPPAEPDAKGPLWSIAEVLAHLLFHERLQAERIALAFRDDGAVVTPTTEEENREAALLGRVSPVPQLIHGLLASRREIERLLDQSESLDGGLERAVLYAKEGRQTVARIIREQVISLESQYAQRIERIKAALAEAKAAAQ